MGHSEGDKLTLTQKETPDPRTMARQEHLFSQAEQYARQSPFQQQYGYGRQMVPGFSGMSQTGQQYLTDKILGKGAYGYQNLGFQDYRRPELAPIGGYQYGGSGLGVGQDEKAIAQSYKGKESYETALKDPSAWYAYMRSRHGDDFQIKDDKGVAVDLDRWNALTRDQQQALIVAQRTPGQTWEYGNPFGGQTWMSESDWRQEFTNPNSALKSYLTGGESDTGYFSGGTRALGLAGERPYQKGMPGLPETGYEGEWNPWARGYPKAERPPYEQNIWMDQAQPPFGEQNLPDATSAEAYQASLNPNIVPGSVVTGIPQTIGEAGSQQLVNQAGMPALLQTDLPRPTSGVGIGEIEDARTATRRLLTQAGPGGVPGYNQFLPGGWSQVGTAGTGVLPDDPSISVLGSQAITDPTAITDVPSIEQQNIAELGAPQDIDRVAAGGIVNTEPNVTVEDVTPSEFSGASYLQGPGIDQYMDRLGVSAQVTQAEEDFARALAQEESRRAAAGAWGMRGELPAREQQQQMLARIAEIRRKGYTDAADRMEADLQRSQAASMQTQELGTTADLQGQQLSTQARMQEQQLGSQRTQRKAELDLQAALANQESALQSGSQEQQLAAQRAIRQAELNLEQQKISAGMQTDIGLQQQQLEQQAGIRAAELEAQRQQREAELRLQRGMQTQQLGADAAAQQTQNEFARRQALAEMGLRAQGMGMDDRARFREQQMALAQQLGRQGMDEQAATFAAAQQLAQMGGTQEQRQQMQAAADYEQWLRSQEGFADEAAFLQAMQPQAGMAQYQRKPSTAGQIFGGLLSAGGAAATAFGSDARIKDNIEYVGMENGFKTYEFNYLGRNNRYRGVMAQEVMVERPDAVEIQDGFYRVNYDAIGVQFEAV